MSKIVIVKYTAMEAFKIPKGIDLEDESVVKDWGVKWNKLYITFIDGTEKVIEGENWVQNLDLKYPDDDETTIVPAEDYGLEEENDVSDDDDDEDEDPKTKPCSCGCNVIGGSCDKGLAIDNGEDDEEIQPYCYKCFNMNMSINVNCFNCDKLYCKSHSYCILGDDDMPYCSKECFLR